MFYGLTIAFICSKKDHPTIQNFQKFGDKYWDDTINNDSKIGYYFAYYYQKKYVYIHKIIDILQPNHRPIEMLDWVSNRQILCLSERLQTYSWEEWIHGIGNHAPYTSNYRNTQTSSWSCTELQNHKDFRYFDLIKFKNSIENKSKCKENIEVVENEDEEEILLDKLEKIRKKKEILRLQKDVQDLSNELDSKKKQIEILQNECK